MLRRRSSSGPSSFPGSAIGPARSGRDSVGQTVECHPRLHCCTCFHRVFAGQPPCCWHKGRGHEGNPVFSVRIDWVCVIFEVVEGGLPIISVLKKKESFNGARPNLATTAFGQQLVPL